MVRGPLVNLWVQDRKGERQARAGGPSALCRVERRAEGRLGRRML